MAEDDHVDFGDFDHNHCMTEDDHDDHIDDDDDDHFDDYDHHFDDDHYYDHQLMLFSIMWYD